MTLREYAPGDDLRHVHWRSTARRGHLMMRQNETRRRTPVLLMLDVRPGTHDRASFERAVEASASIATALDRSGRPFEVCVEHRADDRRARAPPPRAHHGRARGRRAARRRPLIIASTAPPQRRAHRGHRPRPTQRRRRASACSSATAACSTVVEAAERRALSSRSRRFRDRLSSRTAPTDHSPTPGTRRCCDGSAPAVDRRHRHPRPPDRRRGARARPRLRGPVVAVVDAARGARAAAVPRWTSAGTGRHPAIRLAVVGVVGCGSRSSSTIRPRRSSGSLPAATMAELGSALGDAPHALRSAVVPSRRSARRSCSRWSPCSSPRSPPTDRAAGSTRPSARSGRASRCSSRSPPSAPAVGRRRPRCTRSSSLEYLVALAATRSSPPAHVVPEHAARGARSVAAGGIARGAVAVVAALDRSDPACPARGGSPAPRLPLARTGSGIEGTQRHLAARVLSIGAKLTARRSARGLHRVDDRAKGNYWRVIALDQFHDDGWGLNGRPAAGVEAPGPDRRSRHSTPVHQQFHLAPARPALAPGRVPPGRHQPHRGSQVLPGSPHVARRLAQPACASSCTTSSRRSRPRRRRRSNRADAATTAATCADDLALPDQLPGVGPHARPAVTRNARNAVRQGAVALDERSSRRRRSRTTPTPTSATTPTRSTQFLFETQGRVLRAVRGRRSRRWRASVGLPARVAVGYQPGTLGADGLWHVTRRRTRTPGPRCGSTGRGLVPVRADARPHATRRSGSAPAGPRSRGRPTTTGDRADEPAHADHGRGRAHARAAGSPTSTCSRPPPTPAARTTPRT